MTESPDTRISRDDGLAYWNSIETTVDGMLGGFARVSRVDMRKSLSFISKLRSGKTGPITRAVDIGAGIGRITAGVLSHVANTTDIVEPVAKFAAKAGQLGSTDNDTSMGKGKVGQVYVVGVEDWIPEHKYDLIWIQWCLGHLTGSQMVICLRRCKEALADKGWIVVKENQSTDPHTRDMFDETDSSVTRTDANYHKLFTEAGLTVVRTELQKGFPVASFPVKTYALRPKD